MAVPFAPSAEPADLTESATDTKNVTPADVKPITPKDASTGGPDVLAQFALPTSYVESLDGVKKMLTHVPVRRAHRSWWWMVNRLMVMRAATLSDESGGQTDTYLVKPALIGEYPGEIALATLHGAINRQGTFFIVSAKLPGPDGRLDPWTQSLRTAIAMAEGQFVRTSSNRDLGAYEVHTTATKFEPPKWPNESWEELVSIAFRGRIIDTHDHPILRRLRGEV